MNRTDQLVLVIQWDQGVLLPSVVGPFLSAHDAAEWASLNIPNGTWKIEAMSYPYARSQA